MRWVLAGLGGLILVWIVAWKFFAILLAAILAAGIAEGLFGREGQI